MPIYVSLMKLTEKGIADIKKAPERIVQTEKVMGQMGGKILAFYALMGEYDYLAVTEGPSDEVAMTVLMMIGAGGNVRTLTMKAFERTQFEDLVSKLQ